LYPDIVKLELRSAEIRYLEFEFYRAGHVFVTVLIPDQLSQLEFALQIGIALEVVNLPEQLHVRVVPLQPALALLAVVQFEHLVAQVLLDCKGVYADLRVEEAGDATLEECFTRAVGFYVDVHSEQRGHLFVYVVVPEQQGLSVRRHQIDQEIVCPVHIVQFGVQARICEFLECWIDLSHNHRIFAQV